MKASPEILRAALDLAIASGHPDPWDLAPRLAQVAMACRPMETERLSPPHPADVPPAALSPEGRGEESRSETSAPARESGRIRHVSEARIAKIVELLRRAPWSSASEVAAASGARGPGDFGKVLSAMAGIGIVQRAQVRGAGYGGLVALFAPPGAGPVPGEVRDRHAAGSGRKAGGWKGGYATRTPGSMASDGVATEKRADGVTVCPPRYAEGYRPESGRVNPSGYNRGSTTRRIG